MVDVDVVIIIIAEAAAVAGDAAAPNVVGLTIGSNRDGCWPSVLQRPFFVEGEATVAAARRRLLLITGPELQIQDMTMTG
jgi:hypothetical protein